MTYYTVLELEIDATPDAIRQAYLRLARTHHPDHVPGNDAQFIAIKDAYDILSNTEKRHAYDQWLADGGQGKYVAARLPPHPQPHWEMVSEPFAYNNYSFVNAFLNTPVDDEEYLITGQAIDVSLHRRLESKLHTASGILYSRRFAIELQLQSMTAQDPQYEALNEQVNVMKGNGKKIAQVLYALFTGLQEKFIYDMSLGSEEVTQTQEMEDMARLMGGRQLLKEHLKVAYDLHTAGVFFELQQVGCLNPENFARFAAARTNTLDFSSLSSLINRLFQVNLLNQTNFDHALKHPDPPRLAHGVSNLGRAYLVNQACFEQLLTCHNAEAAASSLRLFKDYNLLSEFNYRKILELSIKHDIDLPLIDIIARSGKLTPEDGLALQWSSSRAEVQSLCQRIDEVFAYGMTLAASDKDKALPVFLLALDLKKALRNFYELPEASQVTEGAVFHRQFLELLHSRDTELAQHRQRWKVLLANVAIALTGLGLVALVGHTLVTGHGFFHRTRREQLRDELETQWTMIQPLGSA